MQQRVAIARAVAYEPKVLFMDEPFDAVDAQTRSELKDLVCPLWERLKVTVLFVAHDIDEAIYLGERVLVVSSRPTVVKEDILIGLPPQPRPGEHAVAARIRGATETHLWLDAAHKDAHAQLAGLGIYATGGTQSNLAFARQQHRLSTFRITRTGMKRFETTAFGGPALSKRRRK